MHIRTTLGYIGLLRRQQLARDGQEVSNYNWICATVWYYGVDTGNYILNSNWTHEKSPIQDLFPCYFGPKLLPFPYLSVVGSPLSAPPIIAWALLLPTIFFTPGRNVQDSLSRYLPIVSRSSGGARERPLCCVSVQHNLGWRLHRSQHRGTAADCRHHSPSATAKTSIGLNNHNLEPPNCRLRCICPQSFLYLFQAWKKSI